jgi:hypothetical protein
MPPKKKNKTVRFLTHVYMFFCVLTCKTFESPDSACSTCFFVKKHVKNETDTENLLKQSGSPKAKEGEGVSRAGKQVSSLTCMLHVFLCFNM